MTAVQADGISGMKDLLGRRLGPTDWRQITQEDIDAFASLSGDDQWIHVDAQRARSESPYGTTIAHGNLTLATVDGFRLQLIETTGFTLGVNYGWDRVRFPAAVPVGARIRGMAELISFDHVGKGWWQPLTRFTIEVEGNEKPCFVGDSVSRLFVVAE